MVELSRRLVQIVPEEVWPQSIDSAIFTARSRNVYQTLVMCLVDLCVLIGCGLGGEKGREVRLDWPVSLFLLDVTDHELVVLTDGMIAADDQLPVGQELGKTAVPVPNSMAGRPSPRATGKNWLVAAMRPVPCL